MWHDMAHDTVMFPAKWKSKRLSA